MPERTLSGPVTGAVEAVPGAAEPPVSAPSLAPMERPVQLVRLGVLAGRDAGATLNALGPAADGLSQALGRPVEFLPMSSYDAMIDAQTLARIDGGFYSASAYAEAQAGCRCLEPLVAPAAGDGTTAYYAILVTGSDAAAASVVDLKGKTVASGSADSIAARRMPLAALLAEGVDAEAHFAAIRDAGSGEQAIRLMMSGEVDAAFAWTSFEGDAARGYSRGTLADMVARGELTMSEIAVAWRSPPIAHGPLAVGPNLSEAEKTALEGYLLGLEKSQPAAYDALNPFYAGGYAAVDPEDYDGATLLVEQDLDALQLADPLRGTAGPEQAQTP